MKTINGLVIPPTIYVKCYYCENMVDEDLTENYGDGIMCEACEDDIEKDLDFGAKSAPCFVSILRILLTERAERIARECEKKPQNT